ncbi:MAG: LemA family protein [Elusimicrobia bacterium]|nr:LemA family protein [Elusimicrobiota bacterium]
MVIIAGAGFYLVQVYNGLVFVKQNVQKTWMNIDVLLKQRHDELPKLLDLCNAYMKFEQETLQKVIQARASAIQAQGVSERARSEGGLSQALGGLFAVAERYPELKAHGTFQTLQTRVSQLENQIADRREFYNESVNIYNIRLGTIPDTFVASWLGYQPAEYYHVPDTDKADLPLRLQTP